MDLESNLSQLFSSLPVFTACLPQSLGKGWWGHSRLLWFFCSVPWVIVYKQQTSDGQIWRSTDVEVPPRIATWRDSPFIVPPSVYKAHRAVYRIEDFPHCAHYASFHCLRMHSWLLPPDFYTILLIPQFWLISSGTALQELKLLVVTPCLACSKPYFLLLSSRVASFIGSLVRNLWAQTRLYWLKKMNTEWGKLNAKNCKKLMVGLNYH